MISNKEYAGLMSKNNNKIACTIVSSVNIIIVCGIGHTSGSNMFYNVVLNSSDVMVLPRPTPLLYKTLVVGELGRKKHFRMMKWPEK